MTSSVRAVSSSPIAADFRALTCENPVSEGGLTAYVHACDRRRAGPWGAVVSGRADGWIGWTTTGCVARQVHLHFYGMTAEGVAAILARVNHTTAETAEL